MQFFRNRRNASDRRYRCTSCGRRLREDECKCPKCGATNSAAGWIVPGRDRCGNCNKKLAPDDRYCPYCGTRAGEGKYEPYVDFMQDIYGPMPVDRYHLCADCGHHWKTCLMIDDQRYCPRCGSMNLTEPSPGLVLRGVDTPSTLRITMDMPALTIGRLTLFEDPEDAAARSVSRKHCRLLWQEGQVYLSDLNSTNGTLLNGKRLEPGRMTLLQAGDEVSIGRCRFKVEPVDAGESCP